MTVVDAATIVFTDRSHGDLSIDGDPARLEAARRLVVDQPWTWLRQVHGASVVRIDGAGHRAGEKADGAVTNSEGAPLAIHVADCAPVAFTSPEGVIGVAHAGWRGLLAGVIESTVSAMRSLGAGAIRAELGPCIGPECYEFGAIDLEALAGRFGDQVVGRTAGGSPALDIPAAVSSATSRLGVTLDTSAHVCTACDARYFSHRAGDDARHALVVWTQR